jgi:ribosomal protein L29
MATVTAKSLREKTNGELQDQLILEKKKLFDGIVKGASGEAIKAHEKRAGRRLIARIQSILSERNRRVQLDAQIKVLTPKAAKADAQFVRLVKNVDERAAGFTSELAKPAGQRRMRPHLKRVRTKHFIAAELNGNGGANRHAVHLAEARRVRHALEREDMGAGK